MNKVKSDSNDDMFSTFLVKEQELDYVEERHAQACILKMSNDYQKRESQATFLSRIKNFFSDCKDSHQLRKLKKEWDLKLSQIPDEDKCDKEIDHKGYKHGDFKTHIFFEQKYTERNIIADCGGIHFSVIEYEVYIRVEYSIAEIWTKKHLEKKFDNYNEAKEYYEKLRKEYKNKSAKDILNYLTKKIDSHCDELKKRIIQFGYEL